MARLPASGDDSGGGASAAKLVSAAASASGDGENGAGVSGVDGADSPEDVAAFKTSHTGRFLKALLERDGHALNQERPDSKVAVADEINRVRGRRARGERVISQ